MKKVRKILAIAGLLAIVLFVSVFAKWGSGGSWELLTPKDIANIDASINKVPKSQQLDLLNMVLKRVESMEKSIKKINDNNPISKNTQKLKLLSEIQDLLQSKIDTFVTVTWRENTIPNVNNNHTWTISQIWTSFNTTVPINLTQSSTTLTWIVLWNLDINDNFIISDSKNNYAVFTDFFSPWWTQTFNLRWSEVPLQYIQTGNTVVVTGILNGLTIHAKTIVVMTNKDWA